MTSNEAGGLSAAEIELCRKLGFDEKIAAQVKKKTNGQIEQLTGYADDGNEVPANGITIPVDEDDAYSVIEELWNDLQGSGYIAFYSERNFGDKADKIGVIHSDDEFDILRIKRTNGANYDIQTEDIIDKIREWAMRYPLTLLGADFDWVEMIFDELPADVDAFAEEVYEFCPDTVDQGTETLEALSQSIKDSGVLFMWWD